MGKWAKEFDAGSKAYYYYNIETYETSWDKPADFVEDGPGDKLSVSEGLVMLKAVKRIQRGYRAKLARGAMRVKRASIHASEHTMGSCKWVETWDPQGKANYYYHTDTHETSWDPPAEWVKADRKAHPEKYAAKLPAATGKGQNASLDSLGLHAGGNPGGLGGLGLGGEYKSNSAASGLQGLMNKGKSGNGTDGGMGGLGGLGGGGMGLGATDDSASVYAIKNGEDGENGENGENGDESEALIGGGVGQDKNEGGVRRYANTRHGRADEILDKIVDKCVDKCPKKCCGTMRWAWKYEGQPLKLPNPGADHMRGTGALFFGGVGDPDLALCSFLCPCILFGCNERHIDERNDCGGLCVPAFFVGGPCCMIAWSRAKTRSMMGLPDEPWIIDMCASCCCPLCVIAQSAVALRKVALDNKLGLDNPLGIVAPKQEDMSR